MLAHVGAKPGVVTLVQHNAGYCWLPLAAENRQSSRRLRLWRYGLVLEAVLIRRVVDRSVLTADFDPGVGLITWESVVFGQRAKQQPSARSSAFWFAWLPSAGVRLSVEAVRWSRMRKSQGHRSKDVETWRDKMTFEECADVHTTRPRQDLSHAHMCASGKCHVQCETLLGPTKLRKMCVRQGVLSTRVWINKYFCFCPLDHLIMGQHRPRPWGSFALNWSYIQILFRVVQISNSEWYRTKSGSPRNSYSCIPPNSRYT